MPRDEFGGLMPYPEDAPRDEFGGVIALDEGLRDEFGGLVSPDPAPIDDSGISVEAVRRKKEDLALARRRYSGAAKTAELHGMSTAEAKARANAEYLQGRTSPGIDQEDIDTFFETDGRVSGMPGRHYGFMKMVDTGDMLTSPVSRPGFSGLAAKAGVLGLAGKSHEDRIKFVNNLHPEDKRRAHSFWEISETLKALEDKGLSSARRLLLKSKLDQDTIALATTYELPGIDPYGMGALPQPWQEVGPGGVVIGGEPNSPTDIILRGMAGQTAFPQGAGVPMPGFDAMQEVIAMVQGVPGEDGIDDIIIKNQGSIARAGRSKIHSLAEYMEVPFESAAALVTGGWDEAVKAWDRSSDEAYKVWSGDPDADPREGSFLPGLVFMIAPDLAFSSLTKGVKFLSSAKGARHGAGGVMTGYGDGILRAQSDNVVRKVKEDVFKWGDTVDEEVIDFVLDKATNYVGQAFQKVGDDTAEALRLGKGSPAVHIDVSDAIDVVKTTEGRIVAELNHSKVRVLRADDPLVLQANRDAVLRGLPPSEIKALEDAVASIGNAGSLSQARVFAELSDRGFGRGLALHGALGFAGGFAGSEEEGLDRLKDAMKMSLGAVAGSAIIRGGGIGIGKTVDSAGRAVTGLAFKTGSVSAEGISQGFIAGLESFRGSMPGFKRLKPWSKRELRTVGDSGTVPKVETVHVPLTAADLVQDHFYARAAFLKKQKRYTLAKLKYDLNKDIFDEMRHVKGSDRKEVLMDLVESMGAGDTPGDLGTKLIYGFRRHLMKALEVIPDTKNFDEIIGGLDEKLAAEGLSKAERAKLQSIRKKAVAEEGLDDAADEVRRLLGDDPFGELATGTTAEVLRRHAEKTQIVNSMLRQVLGVDSPASLAGLRALHKETTAFMQTAKKDVLSNKAMMDNLGGLTALETRDAAVLIRKEAYKSDPRYAAMSDRSKQAVEGVREFFLAQFRILKAEGGLSPDHSLEQFMFEMDVSGYIPHMLNPRNADNALNRLRDRVGYSLGELSDVLDPSKRRGITGTVAEINRGKQREIAKMIYREQTGAKPGELIPDEVLDDVIAKNGLEKVKYFESDINKVMQSYAGKTSRFISNKRYLDNASDMFPLGKELSALAKQNVVAADAKAVEEGFRRVDGVTHLESLVGDAPWKGFAEHRGAIRELLRAYPANQRGAAIASFLSSRNIDMTDKSVRASVKVLSDDLYLPLVYADMIEVASNPNSWNTWAKERSIKGHAVRTWDDVINYFKSMTTVLAPAFHGRNFISNVVTNYQAHGWDAIKPSNQIDAIRLMKMDPSEPFTLVGKTPAGVDTRVTKTAGEWMDGMRRNGVVIDDLDLSDAVQSGSLPNNLRTGFRDSDGAWRAPAYTTAAGMVAGGVAGYSSGTPEDRVRKAVAGVMFGGMAGMSAGTTWELFLKDPTKAFGEAATAGADPGMMSILTNPQLQGNIRPALSAGFDAWMDAIGGVGVKGMAGSALHIAGSTSAGRVGVAYGAAGGIGGFATADEGDGWVEGLKGAALGFLAGAGGKALTEGSFIIGGGVGRKIEEQSKIANYLAGIKKGMSESGAADVVHRSLFDYDDLTNFERYVLRRIFPFYTWSSKNATELQPWLLQNNPLAYSGMTKAIDALDRGFSTEEDRHLLDEHLQYRAVASSGEGKVVAGWGLPIEDPAEFLKTTEIGNITLPTGLISRIAPPFTQAFMAVTGVDPYYGIDIENIRSTKDVEHLPKEIQDWVGYKVTEFTRTIDGEKVTFQRPRTGHYIDANGEPFENAKLGAYRMALLKAHPAKRLVGEYNKLMLPSFMSSLEVGADDPAATGAERLLAVLSGAKQYAQDLSKDGELADKRMRAWERSLRGSMKSLNLTYDIPVTPKDPESSLEEIEILRDLGLRE